MGLFSLPFDPFSGDRGGGRGGGSGEEEVESI